MNMLGTTRPAGSEPPVSRARQEAESGILLDKACVEIAGKRILENISAHLTESRIGIVGRNGSGKSTLLRLIAGLISPSAGTVRVEGNDPAHERKAMLSAIGILFQNPDHQILFPTVEEELAFGLRQAGWSKEDAARAVAERLAAEGRSHWLKASTNALSQGQRQYLNLMSILLMAPRTILLDEPFAGLDLPTEARLMRKLAALPQRLITITHDPRTVETADRILWLEGGRVVHDGTPDAVLPEFREAMRRLGDDDADTDIAG